MYLIDASEKLGYLTGNSFTPNYALENEKGGDI
jgi:hypothetical protein